MANGSSNGYTPTQSRLLAVLADGLPHSRDELYGCLNDEQALPNTLNVHLTYLRAKLRQHGEDVMVRFIRGRPHYCHVNLRSEGLPDPQFGR